MKLRLTKKNSIAFALVILVLCGSLGYLVWRVNQEETTAPTGSEAAETSQDCNPPCGTKPNLANWSRKPYHQSMKNISDSSKEDQEKGYSIPSSITIPTGVKGEIVLYYKSLESGLLASFRLSGNVFNVSKLDSKGRAIIKTGLHVNGGETFTVNSQVLNGTEEFAAGCVGSNSNRYWSLGWIPPKNNTCGTTFGGPPTNGKCTPYVPVNVSSDITWATSSGNTIISQQCWADWMEWKGDYDFEDYFLVVTVKADPSCGDGQLNGSEECESGNPSGVKCQWDLCNQTTCVCLPPSTPNTTSLKISKSVIKQCKDEETENPKSELSYTITVSNTQTEEAQISKIEDTLDTKIITAGIVPSDITASGSYLNGKITWLFSTPLIIPAGGTQVFSYKIVVNKSNFGTYTNTVVLTPVSGDTIQAKVDVVADCVAVVPQTGIFDNTVGKVAGGFGLILLGAFVYSIPTGSFIFNRHIEDKRRNKYRVKFESKIFKK